MSNITETTVSLSLTFKDGNAALAFYKEAFGAVELFKMEMPDGGVGHAEFQIGDSRIFMSDEDPECHAKAMAPDTMSSCAFSIQVDDCDAAYSKAVKAGAESVSEPKDEFWGMRSALVVDPFGYRWYLGQKTEDLSNEEIAQRAAALFGGCAEDA